MHSIELSTNPELLYYRKGRLAVRISGEVEINGSPRELCCGTPNPE